MKMTKIKTTSNAEFINLQHKLFELGFEWVISRKTIIQPKEALNIIILQGEQMFLGTNNIISPNDRIYDTAGFLQLLNFSLL